MYYTIMVFVCIYFHNLEGSNEVNKKVQYKTDTHPRTYTHTRTNTRPTRKHTYSKNTHPILLTNYHFYFMFIKMRRSCL